MLVKVKQHLKTLFNYAVTVISCVVIIVLGISFFSRATTVTTTIGENISTNDLIVYGNATTTGAHRVSGNLLVDGTTTFNGVAYTWPSADGTSGYALVTNSSGTLSWSTVSSGSGTLNYGAAGSLLYYASSGTTATGTASALLNWDNTNRRLGVATSSPYATLSVAGIGSFDDYVRASYFTATSTTATSTLPYLTSTQSNVGTVVGGNWQGTSIGTQYGGTGQNFSGSTGFIYLNAGAASASSTIAVNVGGTGATSFTSGSLIFSNGSILTQNNSNLFWDNTNNRLGIGTTSPYAKLSVVGETVSSYFTATSTTATTSVSTGGLAVGTNQFIVQQNSGRIGINQTSPVAWLHQSMGDNTYSQFTTANGSFPRVSNAIFELNQTADYPAGDYNLTNVVIDSDLSNKEGGGGTSRFYSLFVDVDSSDSAGQIDEIYAARFLSLNSATSGTQPYLMGLTLDVSCGAGGTCTTISGNTINLTAGSGTNAYGVRVMPISKAGLTINNIYGNYYNLDGTSAGTIGNEYAYYAGTMVLGGVTHTNTPVAFYSADTNAIGLYSAGNVGIGTTSPYAKLSVVGETVSSYFTATSTAATSTLPYLTSTQIAVTGLTAGSIPFIGTGGILAQNNSNLYWDNTNARLGVSSSTPYAKLSVTNSGTGPSFIVEDAASPDNTQFIIDASGNVGIGTSTPTAKLTVQGAGTGLNQTFAVFDSANATSTFVVLDNGYVGVGTSSPWGRFSVEQGNNDTDVFIVADAGTSTPHMRINGAGITTIEQLNTGPMTFETNAGAVSWINLNVDTAVATGTIESYTAQIDDVSILTIYGEAAGSGLIGTTSVGIGTTTPVSYFTVNASTTAPMAAFSVWNVNTAPEGPIASFWDGGTEVFKIDASGNLGIGTSTFTSTLTIGTANAKLEIANGGLCVDSDGGCNASTTGRISAVSFVTAASDIAENYYSDETLTAGDIVITKGGSMVGKADAENQNAVIGIVSTKPGIILGLENDNPAEAMPLSATGIYPVALAGRVPIKVSTESGNISIGDPLNLSFLAGVAKKASEPGKIIGYALENYDGPTIQNNGQILIFIDITYWFPPDYFTADTADTADGANNAADSGNIISQSFNWVLEQFKDIGVAIADGVVSAREFVAEKITAKKAVVDSLEMKDATTGEIYCIKMENGELNKIKGECVEQ